MPLLTMIKPRGLIFLLAADGPCDYCRSISKPCQFDLGKRRQKPYYYVSEEEYRLLLEVCKHFLPDQDLSLPHLRSTVSRFTTTPARCDSQTPLQSLSANTETPRDNLPTDEDAGKVPEDRGGVALQELVDLHEDLGCMLADAHGELRMINPAIYCRLSTDGRQDTWGLIQALVSILQSGPGSVIPPIIQRTRKRYRHLSQPLYQKRPSSRGLDIRYG